MLLKKLYVRYSEKKQKSVYDKKTSFVLIHFIEDLDVKTQLKL